MKTSRVILVLLLTMAGSANADDYAEARSELYAAYQAKEYAAMQVAANRALAARPGYPAATFNLAFAQALGGDAEAALDTLNELAAAGVDFRVAGTPAFAAVERLPGWAG
jgi:thioredoxin-like negative regulator of GroEL